MPTTITGLGSGFDIDSWISSLVSAKKESTVAPLQTKLSTLNTKNSALTSLKSKCSTLLSSLQSFTKTIYDSSSDIWQKTSISSSNSAFATATSKGNVAASSVKLEIDQIATATKATSAHSLGASSKEEIEDTKFTNMANGQAKEGKFSVFVDGKEYKVEIGKDEKMSDVIANINRDTKGRVRAEITDDGHFKMTAYKKDENEEWVEDTDATLTIGSSADTSNFATVLKLNGKTDSYVAQSAYPVSGVLTNVAMTSAESGIKNLEFFKVKEKEEGDESEEVEYEPADFGKITINGVDFTVDKDTTINGLISKINSNSDANVKASFDALNNKFVLTSTETGHNNISLSEEGTNLLNVLGLTEFKDGEEVIAKGSQQLGDNAVVRINDNVVISNSNTITGESSGIANLSITVKKPTSEASGNPDDDKTITLDIEQDYSEIKNKLKSFVSAYNDVVNTIKNETKSGGKIGSDASLRNLSSQLQSILSGSNKNDGMYNLLSQIGISTSRTDISNLSIDDAKLDEALKENLSSVKELLSDGYIDKTDRGIFDKMANLLSNTLDSQKGYFTTMSTSMDSQIKAVNNSITNANTRLTAYQNRITKQFNKMDSTLSALTAQMSTFSSYFS